MENKVTYNNAKLWQIASYAGNNAATNALYIVLMFFFMVYCTEIYGFSPVTVGLIMTGTRLLDAFTDPIIGLLIDKTDSKFGRFRPWMIIGSIILNISFFFMFSGIDLGSKTANLILIVGLYIIWVWGYTFQCSVTKSAQTILTNNPSQRTLQNAISGVYTTVLYVGALSLLFPTLNRFGGISSPAAWRSIALCIIGIQVVLTLLAVAGIWEKDIPKYYAMKTQTEKPKYKDYISLFKDNKALQMLVVAASTNKIAATTISGLTVYLYAYVVKNQALQSVIPGLTLPFGIVATVIVTGLTVKYGRKRIFTLTSLIACIFGVVAVFVLPINPSAIPMLVVILGMTQFMNSATDLNVIPMIADAADYENYTKGRFIPGMIGTAFSLIDKIVSSFGAAISGFALSALGFVSLTKTEPSSKLFWGVLCLYFLIPALGHLASVIAMKWYPINDDFYAEMIDKINQRNANAEVEAEAAVATETGK